MTAPVSQTSSNTSSPASTKPVPLLDVNRGNSALHGDIMAAVERVCRSGRFLFGPDVEQLEKSVAAQAGAEHGIACASGSDALLLALMAIDVRPGEEVIVPSFTFFATASAVWRLGAVPVFVDIDRATFNLNPRAVAEAITPRTRAIIPVHLFGQMADMTPILETARKQGLTVIEDAAQAIGARYCGRGAGSLGEIGCFSFYPTKNLGGYGDGGLLTTNDAALADRLRLFAGHGMRPRYYHKVVGINSRLDSIQAAVLNVKMTRLASWVEARAEHARQYNAAFAEAGLEDCLQLPEADPRCDHVWNQYTIRVLHGRRDRLRERLAAASVGCEVYYPIPLHQQECFRSLGYAAGSLPETERAASEVLSLPAYPELTAEEREIVIHEVVRHLRDFRNTASPARKAA